MATPALGPAVRGGGGEGGGTHGNRLACFAITGPAQAVVGLDGDTTF